jgi:hypothetical protein
LPNLAILLGRERGFVFRREFGALPFKDFTLRPQAVAFSARHSRKPDSV